MRTMGLPLRMIVTVTRLVLTFEITLKRFVLASLTLNERNVGIWYNVGKLLFEIVGKDRHV